MWMINFLRILFYQQGSQCSFVFLCSCQTELSVTTLEVFRKSSDIFGYYRTPTKNLGTLKIKNVTPINVKRLAGIKCLQQFYLSPRKHLLKSIHITELFSAIKINAGNQALQTLKLRLPNMSKIFFFFSKLPHAKDIHMRSEK